MFSLKLLAGNENKEVPQTKQCFPVEENGLPLKSYVRKGDLGVGGRKPGTENALNCWGSNEHLGILQSQSREAGS